MQDKILLAHGGGGTMTASLLAEEIAARFGAGGLDTGVDAAVLSVGAERIAFTTDSYVVTPTFFPGGCIGDLAVCGTVNDLAMAGAEPRWISLALILEEGLPREDLVRILDAIKARVDETGVRVVCGDTKVVPRGEADGIYINTAGVGLVPEGVTIGPGRVAAGDRLLLSGPLGLHGLAVMLARSDFPIRTPVTSDVAPLAAPVRALFEEGVRVKALRDLTRGGLAMALHDFAAAAGVTLAVEEEALPVEEAQRAACDLLGLDPLQIACEGCFLAVVAAEDADRAATILRRFPPSRRASVIGAARARERVAVEMRTSIGSARVLSAPRGENMPRIC